MGTLSWVFEPFGHLEDVVVDSNWESLIALGSATVHECIDFVCSLAWKDQCR